MSGNGQTNEKYVSQVSDNSAEESNQKTRINTITERFKQYLDVKEQANLKALTGDIDEYAATTYMRTALESYIKSFEVLMMRHGEDDYWKGNKRDPIATYELQYPEIPGGYEVERITPVDFDLIEWDDDDEPPTVEWILRNPEEITIVGIRDFMNLEKSFERVVECYPPPPSGYAEWPESERSYYRERKVCQNQLDQLVLDQIFSRANEFIYDIGLDVELLQKMDAEMSLEEIEEHIDGVIPERTN